MTDEPDFSTAMEELRRLSLDDVNLAEALDHFAQTGLPLLVCKVDGAATDPAGNRVLAYKLSDQLQVSLAAVRARKLNSENVGIDHGAAPTGSTPP